MQKSYVGISTDLGGTLFKSFNFYGRGGGVRGLFQRVIYKR